MKEISMHIQDIIQNSVVAGADRIELEINEDKHADLLEFIVTDNGKGMSKELLASIIDPFVTSRKTRRVGLGIPLLKHACEATGGRLEITSQEGVGTRLQAVFSYSHIDRQPLGNVAREFATVVISNENVRFLYRHRVDDSCFEFDTIEIKKILGDLSFAVPEIAMWISDYLDENIKELYGRNE